MEFKTKSGRMTRYGLACGGIELQDNIELLQFCSNGALRVRDRTRIHSENGGMIYQGPNLAKARAAFDAAVLGTYAYEYTDTFAGEPNYCWVKRGQVKARNMAHAVRLAKRALNLSGLRCSGSAEFGLIPRGTCTILFVNYWGVGL